MEIPKLHAHTSEYQNMSLGMAWSPRHDHSVLGRGRCARHKVSKRLPNDFQNIPKHNSNISSIDWNTWSQIGCQRIVKRLSRLSKQSNGLGSGWFSRVSEDGNPKMEWRLSHLEDMRWSRGEKCAPFTPTKSFIQHMTTLI